MLAVQEHGVVGILPGIEAFAAKRRVARLPQKLAMLPELLSACRTKDRLIDRSRCACQLLNDVLGDDLVVVSRR